MNLRTKKNLNYLLTFLLFTGVAIFVYFFIPALRRLNSDRLSVSQLQEKLTEQRQAMEGFRHPTQEEERSWNESKQRLKAMFQLNTDTILFEELTKQAMDCGIVDIIITPQSEVGATRRVAPTSIEGLPYGISENKLLLKISFRAEYDALGRFLQWFNNHQRWASILSLNVKRGLPLVSVEMEVEVHQFFCDF